MHSLYIRSFQSRHRVPDADAALHYRGVQLRLLDGELEAALARAAGGHGPGEGDGDDDAVIVVRRLHASLTLSPRHTEADNARRWSDALSLQLQRALNHAPAREVLRFAHRRQALQAFVEDMLAADGTRDWAWQRLGWLPGRGGAGVSTATRRDAVLRWLAGDADFSVPLLHRLLRSPAWPGLVAWLGDGELQGLAASVLTRVAGPAAAAFDPALPAWARSTQAPRVTSMGAVPDWPRIAQSTWHAAATPQRRLWVLRLAWMLAEAPLARRGAVAVDAALRLACAGGDAGTGPPEPPAAAEGLGNSERLALAPPTATDEGTAPTHAATAAVRAEDRRHGRAAAGTPRRALPTAAVAHAEPVPGPDAWTDHGGLLFLLPLLPACGVLKGLEDPATWPGGLRPALHRLALHLQPMPARDPAALAFCGLPPGAEPPSPPLAAEADLKASQDAALDDARERVANLLAQRIPDWGGPALLPRVLQRRARIVADPGWIDVHLSLRDVSLELRRAALDLDPGFVPWLGIVLRFIYE